MMIRLLLMYTKSPGKIQAEYSLYTMAASIAAIPIKHLFIELKSCFHFVQMICSNCLKWLFAVNM